MCDHTVNPYGLQIKLDNLAAFSACYIMFSEYINYFVHTVFSVVGLKIPYTTQMVVFFGLAMLSVVLIKRIRRNSRCLVLPFATLCLALISYLRLGNNAFYFTDSVMEKLLLYCIPTYVAVCFIQDYHVFYLTLKKYAVFLLVVEVLTVALMTSGSSAFIKTDYQGISYGLLIPLIFWICKKDRTIIEKICLVIAFFVMVFFGGRGPLACALLCVLYQMLMQKKHRPMWILLLGIGGTLLVLFYENILQLIIAFSAKYGFSGSIVKYANMGDVFMLSGRDSIGQNAVDIIRDHPLLGVGMGGTRYWLGVYGFKYGNYPHNILYEFLCDYGVVFGLCLFAVLLLNCFIVFRRRSMNPEAYALFEICFFSTGFMVLLFSSSYLFCPLFFAMLALMPRFGQSSRLPQKK